MMQILETAIIPIEYDEYTKESALELKHILEQNPQFFKAIFTHYQQISYQKNQNSFYLQSNNTINILEKMYAGRADNCNKKDWLDKESGYSLLLYIINKKIKGAYDFSEFPEEEIIQFITYGYIHETKDYENIESYFINPEAKQQAIEEWLYSKYSLELLNYLIEKQYKKIVERLLLGREENLEEALNTMIRITSEAECFMEEQEQDCTISISQEETDNLCKEFLMEIDPTLTWYNLFCNAKKTGVFIENQNDKRVIENKIEVDDWCVFQDADGRWYIYSPRTGTIQDSVYTIHEFIHYIVRITQPILEDNVCVLKELPSLFFEALMRRFLMTQGYPQEELEKDKYNRQLGISKMSFLLLDVLFYIKNVSHGEKITLEQELQKEKKRYKEWCSNEEINLDSLKENIIRTMKTSIEELIEDPWFVEETYPYIIGYRYSKLLLDKVDQDKNVITDLINITPILNTLTPKEALTRLGLKEKDSQNLNNKKGLIKSEKN